MGLESARLISPGGVAVEARTLRAADFWLVPAEPIQGKIILEHARIGILRDEPDLWPEALSLNGATYESLEPLLPAKERLRWLALDPHGYQPQPYEQLARQYAAVGQPAQARRTLLAKERLQRKANTRLSALWSALQDVTVAYGYQPWRALLWLALLVSIGAVVYGLEPPKAVKPGEAPQFNAVSYTLDLLIPLVDLGQEHAYNPTGAYQWLSYALVASGWILVSVIAAAVARVLSRR